MLVRRRKAEFRIGCSCVKMVLFAMEYPGLDRVERIEMDIPNIEL